MEHVHAELRRISARLQGLPEPNEHPGLYAAQQALSWALNPCQFAPPFRTITGMREDEEDYCRDSCRPESEETAFPIQGAA